MSSDTVSIEVPQAHEEDARRLDVDAKQQVVAELLHDSGSEGLLILHPPNFRWLTAGANPVGLFGRDELPGLFFNAHQRWLLASATDTPRYFAEELDGLGFQMKEWHWSVSREQLLADLVFGRKIVGDQPFRDCKNAGPFFAAERRKLSPYEIDRLRELGELVVHAVEATARNFSWGDTEEEVAAHLAHRLLRHSIEPIALQVMGDGRGRAFRRRSARPDAVESSCVIQATGRKFGLHVTASRTIFRSEPEERDRLEFDAALRLRVSHLAATRVGEPVASTLEAGKRLLHSTAYEHEWWLTPPAMLTGREPSEGVFLASAKDRWLPGWAVVWQERIGAAAVVDTYALSPEGWQAITPAIEGPIRRAVVPGRSFDLPDILVQHD